MLIGIVGSSVRAIEMLASRCLALVLGCIDLLVDHLHSLHHPAHLRLLFEQGVLVDEPFVGGLATDCIPHRVLRLVVLRMLRSRTVHFGRDCQHFHLVFEQVVVLSRLSCRRHVRNFFGGWTHALVNREIRLGLIVFRDRVWLLFGFILFVEVVSLLSVSSPLSAASLVVSILLVSFPV